jgi:hypothetical protein
MGSSYPARTPMTQPPARGCKERLRATKQHHDAERHGNPSRELRATSAMCDPPLVHAWSPHTQANGAFIPQYFAVSANQKLFLVFCVQ